DVLPAFDGALGKHRTHAHDPLAAASGEYYRVFHSCSSPFLSRSTPTGNCLSVFSSMNFRVSSGSIPQFVGQLVISSTKENASPSSWCWNARFIARFASLTPLTLLRAQRAMNDGALNTLSSAHMSVG